MLLLLAACSDTSVGKFNGEPTASILSHVDGDPVLEGSTVTFSGAASDPDSPETDLAVTWSMNGTVGCEGYAEDGGATSCDLVIPDGSAEVLLEVHDPDGAAVSAKVRLDVIPLESPVVSITAPLNGAHAYSDQPLELSGLATDADDAHDHLSYVWTAEGELASGTVGADDTFADVAFLPEGNQTLTLTVTDDDGNTGEASVGVVVSGPDTAPTCAISSPGDGDVVVVGDEVLLQGTVSDAEQAEDTLTVSWSSDRDGVLATPGADSSGTSTATTTLSAGTHILTLAATDEVGLGCSDTVVLVVGSPPDIWFDAPTDGAVIGEATPLDIDLGVSDADGAADAVTITLSSDLDGVLAVGNPDSSGDAVLSDALLSVGTHTLTATATDTDALSSTTSIRVTIDGRPTPPTVSISPSDPTTLDDLVGSASGSTDPEGSSLSYTYEWWIDGAYAASGATLPASSTTRGDTWELRVSASDGVSSSDVGAASVTIANSAPSATGATIDPSPATASDDLRCTLDGYTDADGDADLSTYAWTLDGLTVGTGATLTSGFSRGDVVTCTITPDDGLDTGALVSAAITIEDSAPGAPVVVIDPPDPIEGEDDLVCELSSPSADPDGDTVSYSMSWTVDGVPYAGGTSTWPGDTVPASATTAGEAWTCTATPSDGLLSGTTDSASVTIGSAATDYTDTWTLDRTVSYTCAFGLVSINFSTMRVVDSYPDVDVTVGGNPGTMSGTFTTDTTIDADNVLPGTCTETYTVAGTFVDANTFNGSFGASYAGSCFGCLSQNWTFTATR